MFEEPEAKRIRRDEVLPSRTPTPEPVDSATASYAAATLQRLFGPIETVDAQAPTGPKDASHAVGDATHEADEEEQEFEFRLFNVQPPTADSKHHEGGPAPAQQEVVQKLKIRLRSPSPTAEGDGGFVVPSRGWDYYLSAPDVTLKNTVLESAVAAKSEDLRRLRAAKLLEFAKSAVSVEDILAFSKQQKAGCHLSWRVIRLKPSAVKLKNNPNGATSTATAPTTPASLVQHLENPLIKTRTPKSRNKPGKKRRIVLRQRALAKQQNEELERNKRTARNREKKLKRRQREREKKAATRETEGSSLTEENADRPDDASVMDD